MTMLVTNQLPEAFEFERWPTLENEVTVGDIRMLCLPPGHVNISARRASHTINIALNTNTVAMAFNTDKVSQYKISSGSMAYFPKDSTLKLQCENKIPEYLIEIGDQTMDQWKKSSGLDELMPFDDSNPYQLDPTAAELGRLGVHHLSNRIAGSPPDRLMCEALILGVSARFLSVAETAASNKRHETSDWNRRHGTRRLQQSVEYALENLSDPHLKIVDMAAVAGISSCHFSEVFKETFNITPYAFVKTERLKMAKDLISHTIMPLSEVAYNCAFSSQSHMTSAFKTHFGISPAKLRN